MRQPKGFEVKRAEKQVCLLRKELYKFKQVGHMVFKNRFNF
jgi:hypothetical protein